MSTHSTTPPGGRQRRRRGGRNRERDRERAREWARTRSRSVSHERMALPEFEADYTRSWRDVRPSPPRASPPLAYARGRSVPVGVLAPASAQLFSPAGLSSASLAAVDYRRPPPGPRRRSGGASRRGPPVSGANSLPTGVQPAFHPWGSSGEVREPRPWGRPPADPRPLSPSLSSPPPRHTMLLHRQSWSTGSSAEEGEAEECPVPRRDMSPTITSPPRLAPVHIKQEDASLLPSQQGAASSLSEGACAHKPERVDYSEPALYTRGQASSKRDPRAASTHDGDAAGVVQPPFAFSIVPAASITTPRPVAANGQPAGSPPDATDSAPTPGAPAMLSSDAAGRIDSLPSQIAPAAASTPPAPLPVASMAHPTSPSPPGQAQGTSSVSPAQKATAPAGKPAISCATDMLPGAAIETGTEPLSKPRTEPRTERSDKPNTETAPEPASDSKMEPAPQTAPEHADESTTGPAPKPAPGPATQSALLPAPGPGGALTSAPETALQSAPEPAPQPATGSATRSDPGPELTLQHAPAPPTLCVASSTVPESSASKSPGQGGLPAAARKALPDASARPFEMVTAASSSVPHDRHDSRSSDPIAAPEQPAKVAATPKSEVSKEPTPMPSAIEGVCDHFSTSQQTDPLTAPWKPLDTGMSTDDPAHSNVKLTTAPPLTPFARDSKYRSLSRKWLLIPLQCHRSY